MTPNEAPPSARVHHRHARRTRTDTCERAARWRRSRTTRADGLPMSSVVDAGREPAAPSAARTHTLTLHHTHAHTHTLPLTHTPDDAHSPEPSRAPLRAHAERAWQPTHANAPEPHRVLRRDARAHHGHTDSPPRERCRRRRDARHTRLVTWRISRHVHPVRHHFVTYRTAPGPELQVVGRGKTTTTFEPSPWLRARASRSRTGRLSSASPSGCGRRSEAMSRQRLTRAGHRHACRSTAAAADNDAAVD